jgi:hypothetical protein
LDEMLKLSQGKLRVPVIVDRGNISVGYMGGS